MCETNVLEKIKTHFTFSNFFEISAVYKIIWENIVEPAMLQITVWLMRSTC